VIAIPRHPPITTRRVGIASFEPAVFALKTPVKRSPKIVKTTMLKATFPAEGAKVPKNGTRPPAVKERADAIAACIGLALVYGC
jgi:hypothetical protein